MDKKKISKKLSYILRHHPEQFGLKLDNNGWILINELLNAIHKEEYWKDLSQEDVEKMMSQSDKQRFEIKDNKIRAVYGHSFNKKIELEEKQPPEILFHGTASRFVDNIKEKGLLPMERQYVHLSADEETAKVVGRRRDAKPVILKIKSRKAFNDGVRFYHGNEDIWLSDKIDSKYIDF